MRIREKLVLIVIASILVTAIPAALWVTAYAKDKILSREIKNLLNVTQNQSEVASDRLEAGEAKLKSLARLLQDRLKAPVQQREVNAFHRQMTLNEDGVWRNKREGYDGTQEAGIFLPESPNLTDRQKVAHLRIKQVMDTFGSAANRLHENIWYLSPYRSEVIFDTTFPEFVYDQAASNDYTQTPWVTYTSPEVNPDREYTFTPPLFDPVPKVWMVSALYPLYLDGKWMGSLGEDMQLTSVLGFMFEDQQLYPDTQHFLIDNDGNFVLAGQWQQQLESATEQDKFNLDQAPELQAMFETAVLSDKPALISELLPIAGENYIAIGMRLNPVNWSYFRLVRITNIVAPVEQLMTILFLIVLAITALCGGLITIAINKYVVSRIMRLSDAMNRYEVGDRQPATDEAQGQDEIMQAAREFDVMADRIADARLALAESEQRWNYALEGAGDGVWDLNIPTGAVLLSPQWKKMLGYEDAEIANEFSSWERLVHPDDKQIVLEKLDAYITGCSDCFAVEFRMRCKDGSWKWILSRGAIVDTDPELGPLRMIGTHTDISYLKTIQNKLENSTEQLNELLEHSPIAIRIAAEGGHKLIFTNRRYAELINCEPAKTLGLDPAEFYVNKADYQRYLDIISTGGSVREELTQMSIPGIGLKSVLATYLPINYDDQDCVLAWFYDVTDWVKAQEALRLNASVFDNAWEGIMITDHNNRIITVNNAFTEITGYHQQEVIGQDPCILSSGRQDESFYKQMWQAIHLNGRWRGEVWNRRKNGEFYAESLTVSAIRNQEGEITHYLGLFADITDIKDTERQLEDMAHYDALTQLANRTLLSDRLEQSLSHARRNQTMLAVCFLDLDGFKPVNDMYGHEIGDKLLIEIGKRLNAVVRSGDTVARMGGDEFVLLVANLNHIEELDPILTRVNQKIAEKVYLGERVISVSASIGVAIYPQDNVDADTLLRHADLSMYQAKQAGRDGYHIFDVKLDQQLHERHAQTERIAAALQNQEFCLYYQPKVNMQTHEVVGMEALIRWQHPEQGLLGAAEFLPVIESHQLIIAVGDWVLDQAMQQIQFWLKQGLEIQVSVNVSARQIQHVDFIKKLKALLARYPDVSPGLLELELLETSALETYQTARIVEITGAELGVSFALDDFGTGYSSLAYLRQLPVRTLKIDRSFVSSMLQSDADMAIVKGIIELAQVFKRNIIAEGVETWQDCERLLSMGCETVQGYYIARPMSAEAVADWVRQFKASELKQAAGKTE